MLNRALRWFFLIATLSVDCCLGQQPYVWQLERSKNGIEVFTRKEPGISIKSFRALTWVAVKPRACLALLNDVAIFKRLFPDCMEARTLVTANKDERTIYIKTDVPFPFSDRDMCVHYKLQIINDTVRIQLTSQPGVVPQVRGVVRIEKYVGLWVFIPRGAGTQIVYEGNADPAGTLPDWLVNLTLVDNPYVTLVNFKQLVVQPPYKEAAPDSF